MPRPSSPAGPWGVPLAVRPRGYLQIGSSPRSGRVVGPLADADLAALLRWGSTRQPAHDPRRLDGLLADLAAAGIPPAHAPAAHGRAGATVAVVGGGASARTLLRALRAAGVGALVTGEDPAPATWDLVVLFDRHAARSVSAEGLLADGVPHLSVVLRDTDALVGPLVLPGTSPCLRCLDLHRTDVDPGWPMVLDQFTREAGPAGVEQPPEDLADDGGVATAVAGLAALQVLAHLDGGRPTALGATLELLVPEGTVQQRRWAAHPQCGCLDLPLPVPG